MKHRLISALGVVAAVAACSSDKVTGPNLPTAPTISTALALGARFSCGLTSDARPFCWGDGLSGEIGDSTFVSKLVPALAVSHRPFVAIAAGVATACALDQMGLAWCWGDDPTQPRVPVSLKSLPSAVTADRAFGSISVGGKFACGLDGDGSAYCWGENTRGQLGVGDTLPHASATRTLGGLHFASITTGYWHTCGLTASGAAYCWGDNQYGELGTGDTLSSRSPRAVSGSTTFRSLSAGSIHQCGLTTSGAAFCWGSNFSGQVGDGTSARHVTPTAVAPGLTFSSIHGGRANSIFGHTCGISSGDVYCWGWGSKGQLGSAAVHDPCVPFRAPGTTNDTTNVTLACSYSAVKVNGISNVVALDVGQEHTCAIIAAGDIYCWGENAHGELGDGSGVAQSLPVLVKGGLKFP